MQITSTAAAVVLLITLTTLPSTILAQECLLGAFELEFDGTCTPEAVLRAYEYQVFNVAGATPSTCNSTAAQSLNAKLALADLSSLEELCTQVYRAQERVPFNAAANRGGDDLHFERMFFNGRTDWQEEVETAYERADGAATSVLKRDAEAVRVFREGRAKGRRVEWPGTVLPNFQSGVTDANDAATCTSNAAMCCWPKDRQANDNNGNCATNTYAENCVDKDPADNTNLCYVDMERGNASTGYASKNGFMGFPEDNGDGEGAIHCHGLAWSNDVNDHTARYKANNLFFVSMYDHMYQRGYVKNIPGAPMCGCVEQMPTVTRSDCTQVDLTEAIKITFDPSNNTFDSKLTYINVEFNACKGINNRNNDLWAYVAKLYYQGDVTPQQFGEVGRILTDTNCEEATRAHLNKLELKRGYDHDVSMYTKVAGRDDLYSGHNYKKAAFKKAFWEHSLTKPSESSIAEFVEGGSFGVGETPIILRICATCSDDHKKIWYRRKTPVTNPDFDLLHNILFDRNNGGGQNTWNEDFSLHSSYDDAVSGENPWLCHNGIFNYGASFYGECSPSGARVTNQYSVFSWGHGPRHDVAYYINKPEDSGIQEINLSTSQRFSSLHTDVDLGKPGIEGSTFEADDGALHVTGGGHDIWGQNDAGHFFSQLSSGDIDVKVHVSSFNNVVNTYAKAGIMLRSDNSNDATHVFAQLSGGYGVIQTVRPSKNAPTSYPKGFYRANPIQKSSWLRLVKKMDTVEFYYSGDGVDWTLYSQALVRFPDDTYRVGLAVTSHHNGYASEAVFEEYSIEEVNFPTASPSISTAPTSWDPKTSIGGAAGGVYDSTLGRTRYRGYGTGIWGRNDSFFFYNEQKGAAGAFDVITYTDYFHTGSMTAKGGIMIRDSDAPDAAHAFIGMVGYYLGASFQSRASAGDMTAHHQTNFVQSHKAWIKLSKAENNEAGTPTLITAFYKIDATDDWIELGSTEVIFTGTTVLVGTAVTAGVESGNSYVDLYTKDFSVVDVPARRNKLLRA